MRNAGRLHHRQHLKRQEGETGEYQDAESLLSSLSGGMTEQTASSSSKNGGDKLFGTKSGRLRQCQRECLMDESCIIQRHSASSVGQWRFPFGGALFQPAVH